MAVWNKELDRDKAVKLLLFLILPCLSLIYSLRNIKSRSSYVVFFLFSVLFGIAFSVPVGVTDSFLGDGAVYREWFDLYKKVSHREFIDGFVNFLSLDYGKKDFYFDTVAFYVSRVTENYHFMFMLFSIVFGYFGLKCFKVFTSEDNFDSSHSSFILAYLFMYNQIFNINGVRFWTAAWIGVYGIFQIFKNGMNRYWLLVMVIPFFHGAFWVYIGIILLAYLLKRFEKFWIVLFIISFFVSSVAVELIQLLQSYLPSFLSKTIGFYTDSEYIKLRNIEGTGFSWVPKIFGFLFKVYINLIVYLFIKNSKLIRDNLKTNSLYLFLLVWMTFVNFVMFVPSLGERFLVLAYPIIAYIWLVNFKGVKYERILYILPFILAWNIFTMIREYNSVLTFDFYFSSPFYLIYKYLIV